MFEEIIIKVKEVVIFINDESLLSPQSFIFSEQDPTVPQFVKDITLNDINKWNQSQKYVTNLMAGFSHVVTLATHLVSLVSSVIVLNNLGQEVIVQSEINQTNQTVTINSNINLTNSILIIS